MATRVRSRREQIKLPQQDVATEMLPIPAVCRLLETVVSLRARAESSALADDAQETGNRVSVAS
jgi:hypothetical protein